MPLFFLLFLFLAVYAEFAVIINVGEEIGAGLTLLAMIGTAVIGLWLVRLQGLDVYRKMAQSAQRGESPVAEMLHGVLLLFAGFLLIIPGFISDGVGALLLIPPIRELLIKFGFWKNMTHFNVRTYKSSAEEGVIEGEFEQKHEPESGARIIEHEENSDKPKG